MELVDDSSPFLVLNPTRTRLPITTNVYALNKTREGESMEVIDDDSPSVPVFRPPKGIQARVRPEHMRLINRCTCTTILLIPFNTLARVVS